MKQYKLSIVAAVYNLEKYLPRCLDALVGQTLQEIEIICVDDGSTDSAPKIIDEYAQKYPEKVKAFHKENGGEFTTRNYGLERATGEYVTFVDTDDYVAPDWAEKLYNAAKENDADMAVCGFERIDLDTGKVVSTNMTQFGKCTKEVDGKDVPDGPEYTLTPVDAEQEIYSITYQDGKTYTGVLDYYISLNRVYPQFYITKCSREGEDSHLHSPIISRLSEIYLNRAEAYAKLGNYSAALADLNTIRERSIIGGGYASLDATNASERIDKERQLELAYQAERSYDVFRNGKPLTRRYPGPHQQFEDIPASDYRVIYYIPQNAINAYPGTLTQNPTDNSGVILN